MATAIHPLRKFQIGVESVKGTGVAATKQLVGNVNFTEPIERFHAAYPRGQRATVGGAGVNLMKGTKWAFDSVLTAEEILWFLSTGIRGGLSPTAGTTTGTSTATGTTTLTDGSATWTTNAFAGASVTSNGKTGTVVSNTGTVLTVTSWSGGTPTSGQAYTITGLDQLWTATPQLTTGIPTLDTVSLEYAESDGSSNHLLGSAAYGTTESFKLGWAFNKEATLSAVLNARANQAAAPTSSLSSYTALETLTSPLLFVYADTTWAGLGGTQLTGIMRSASLDVTTGIMPDWTMDGRSDLDLTGLKIGDLSAKLSLSMELNATAATNFVTGYRSNSIWYIRLKSTGSTIAGSNAAAKYVQVDGAYRFTAEPKVSYDGNQALVSADMEAVYDTTGTKILEFKVNNTLATIAAA